MVVAHIPPLPLLRRSEYRLLGRLSSQMRIHGKGFFPGFSWGDTRRSEGRLNFMAIRSISFTNNEKKNYLVVRRGNVYRERGGINGITTRGGTSPVCGEIYDPLWN